MKIDPEKCIGCKTCLDWCPAEAIIEDPDGGDRAVIVGDLCFECGVCLRFEACPTNAFFEPAEVQTFPRVLRALFSDPNCTHECTQVPGRGTEESKTNDVTGRVRRGEIGLCIEFGRPGLGCTFKDITCMTSRLRELGLQLEQSNPLTALMDPDTGKFPDELLGQRILSAIVELKVKTGELSNVLPAILEVGRKIDTVFSLSVISRFENDGELPVLKQLEKFRIIPAPNAKINFGLGRPLVMD